MIILGGTVLFVILTCINWVEKLRALLSDFIEAQSYFKHIFDNSEESILILCDNVPEYVNDTFLKTFDILFVDFNDEIA